MRSVGPDQGMAIYSSNDAAVALAGYFGGSVEKFVRRMNAKAREMGMKHTQLILTDCLILNRRQRSGHLYPSLNYLEAFLPQPAIHSIEIFVFHDAEAQSQRSLLSYPGVDGLKTGYVKAAGCHLVATATRGDMRLMAIVLGQKRPHPCAGDHKDAGLRL